MSAIRSPASEDVEVFEFWTERLDESRAALGASGELDLAAVTFMDCSCLAVLASTHRRLQAAHGQLILTAVSEPVSRLLVLTGLDEILLSTAVHDGPHSVTEVGPAPAIGARP